MKVKITAESKKILTVAEMPKVKEIIKFFQEEDETPINEFARMAAKVASDGRICNPEIFKATAQIAKNRRADDSIIEGSGDLDVWLEFYVFDVTVGFYEIGVYISDLWQIADDNKKLIKSHMYIDAFTKNKG